MARYGLNCTLSYSRGGATQAYRVRAEAVLHGTEMIAEEDHARTHRAFYPHRTTPQPFAVRVALKGWSERRSFTNWMTKYAQYALDPDRGGDSFPVMTVSIPSREFLSRGVPTQGYEWGDHVGSVVFRTNVVFQIAVEPGQTENPDTSKVDNKWSAFSKDNAIQYFYPIGTQLSGDQAPSKGYDKITYPGDPDGFNDGWQDDLSPGKNLPNQYIPEPP